MKDRFFVNAFGYFLHACLISALFLIPCESAAKSLTTRIDSKYIRTDVDEPQNESVKDELNPKAIVQYTHPLTQFTDLSAEGKFNYKSEETNYKADYNAKETYITKEPQIELRLKSYLYDFKTGYKETWTRANSENNTFGYFFIQPAALPELKINYDHDEQKHQSKKDKLTLKSTYKPTESLRLNFDLRHEYKNFETSSSDNESFNVSGKVDFERTFSSRRPVKIEASYRIESFYKEDINDNTADPNMDTLQHSDVDELHHTFKGKLDYRLTSKTDVILEYENIIKNDDLNNKDTSDEDLQLNMTQRFTDWLIGSGKIRREKTHSDDPNSNTTGDVEKQTTSGQLKANFTDWLQFNGKVIDEQSTNTNLENKSTTTNKTVVQGNLRSEFPNLLRSSQILDYSRTHDSKKESNYFTREERFVWRWDMEPIDNLRLKPEYVYSIIDDLEAMTTKTTHEYEFTLDYNLSINSILALSLYHTTGRKRIRTNKADDGSQTEINDDSTFEVDFRPLDSLFIVSQITRKDYRFTDNTPSEELSYSLNFEWSFSPFAWSNSYKYNDKRYSIDSETFESKLIYDISDYMIEGEYKFNQTFTKEKQKEESISLRLKMVF